LFTPSPEGDENLAKEGIPPEKIFLVGDIMVDSLLFHLDQAKKTNILERLGLKAPTADGRARTAERRAQTSDLCGSEALSSYALMTLHRPANVDDRQTLERIIRALLEVSSHFPILFPVHPRTAKQIKAFDMESSFQFHSSPDIKREEYFEGKALKRKIHCFDPLGYLDFLNLMAHAKVVLTDSGGIQEETTVLNIPCITLRDTTERPITLTEGTNVLVHNDPEKIVAEVKKVLAGQRRVSKCPTLWDGHTAERIVTVLAKHC
jgi:UDP-N-acetylglucosamine 2-epimerase (non-hydrolysing)